MGQPRTDAELVVELIEAAEHMAEILMEVHDLARDSRGDEAERIVELTKEFAE